MLFLHTFKRIGYGMVHLNFKPHYYRRYVDDLWFFTSPEHLKASQNFLNGRHAANMLFKVENEKQNRMPFLEAQIVREDKTFNISVYRKTSFRRVYTHFDRFLPSSYKFGTV